ncbi:MAG: glycoside hydrolase family 172 protein [Bacteroidota bacterium]
MKNQTLLIFAILSSILTGGLYTSCDSSSSKVSEPAEQEVRDVSWFLQRMRTVDHLPELENSHTAMVSTWDTTGNNWDAFIHTADTEENTVNILELEGPGCIHRIFSGFVDSRFDSTRIQIFLDHSETPLFDMPISEFFQQDKSPIPYPLVFIKSYPGSLMPIPYEKHIRVTVETAPYDPDDWRRGAHSEADWKMGRFGVYWQFVYTKYEEGTRVKSLEWPLNEQEQAELDLTVKSWLEAESTPPAAPEQWSLQKTSSLQPGESMELDLGGGGVIRDLRIASQPASTAVLNHLRLRIYWDGSALPSVDVPIGYMWGHGAMGHNYSDSSIAAVMGKHPIAEPRIFMQSERQPYNTNYHSLLLGMTEDEVYSNFPMPFAKGARIELVNTGNASIEQVKVKLKADKLDQLPENLGRFHVTWSMARAATEATPKFGLQNIPGQVVLDRKTRGKYVGVMLQVEWPHEQWWGEGDWLIWTDEQGWPPSYHGTGSEEYFNSGWCMFDRKAVSGFVSLRPGYPTVYSFHLNDAFNFQENIRVVEEQWVHWEGAAVKNPLWSSAAFWYAATATGAESNQ